MKLLSLRGYIILTCEVRQLPVGKMSIGFDDDEAVGDWLELFRYKPEQTFDVK